MVIALFAVVLAGSIARPLGRLRSAADRMTGGDLTVRIARRGARELAELADSFDAMARSLEEGRARLVEASGRAEGANQAKNESAILGASDARHGSLPSSIRARPTRTSSAPLHR